MADPTFCLTVDFDAVSLWLHWDDEHDTPVNRSRGRFGAEEGAPRLLDLLDDRDVPTTWFVPGHTIESFPEPCAAVLDAGHEVQHHGWSHTSPGDYESREAERADMVRGIEAVEALTGSRPTGYRSPSWEFSEHTVELLVELGFEWSSNTMARDFALYDLTDDRAPVDGPYEVGDSVGITEVPVSWQRDDFPPLAFTGTRGFADEQAIFDHWRRQFDWMVDTVDGGVFVLTVHPQVVGRSARLAMLDDLLDYAAYADVEFARVSDVVAARG